MASTTLLGTLFLLIGAGIVAYQLVRFQEVDRSRTSAAFRETREILADAAVKIRIAPREGLARYDEAYERAPRKRIVFDDMLKTARFMLQQASENRSILYNTHDLVKKMIDLGYETPEITSMYETIRYNLTRGKEQWMLNLLAPVRSTPAIHDRVLYTVYQGSKITAQDLNKKGVWPTLVDVVAPISSDLLASQDRICLVTASGWVYAFRAKDGESAWRHKHFERVYEKAFTAADGESMYILLSDGSLTSLSLADGTKRWSIPGDSTATSLSASNDGVLAVTEKSIRWFGADGKPKWERQALGRTYAALTGGGSIVLASGSNVTLVDASNSTLWSTELAASTSAPMIVWGDRVIVPLENHTVAALALVAPRSSGRILWTLKLETEVGEPHSHDHEHKHEHEHKEPLKPGTRISEVCRSPGALGSGKLYLMGQDTLFCIDARSGELEWIYEALGTARTGLLVEGGTVFGGYEDPETKVTFLKAINTGTPSATGWLQFGGGAQRSFSGKP